MNDKTKSGASAFLEWLLGIALGLAALSYLDVSTQQADELRRLVNITCFSLATVGGLLNGQRYKFIKKIGSGLLSAAFVMLGTGAVLIVELYKRQ